MRSWQWRGYVPAEEAYTLGSSFHPLKTEGYPVAVAKSRKASRGSMH